MINFIGLGLKPKHLTREAEIAMINSKHIYVEAYTSTYSEGSIENLEKMVGKKVSLMYRDDAESNFNKIIEEGNSEIISFCVFGNITSATTHTALIQNCVEKDIDFKLYPGISIFSVMPMLSGLQEYRFGETISVVKPVKNYAPSSFFDKIIRNRKLGLHTLCLLDIKINPEQRYFMQAFEAAKRLIEIAKEQKRDISEWGCVVITAACSEKEVIFHTTLGKLSNFVTDYNIPSSIIIYGKLQMDEEEFINSLDNYSVIL